MKDVKRRMEVFSFYDKTGIERHLEKMAADGWMLEKMSALFWQYRRIEPKKIRFSISYYASISDFEPEPTEEQQEFNDFCEHSGWKLAASSVQMQVFYNENEDPVPIETDPELELENLHRYAKKTALKTYPLLLLISLLMGVTFIGSILRDPVYYLASAINLFTGVWFVVAFVYSLSELAGYYLWRRRAKQMAEQGEFLETKGHGWLNWAILIFMLVSLLLYILSIGSTGMQIYMTAFAVNLFAVIFIVQSVKDLMKRKKVAAGTNKTVTAILSFVVSLTLMGCVNVLIISGIRNDVFKDNFAELPFTIGDLTGMDDSGYLKSKSDDDSIFLGQLHSSQHPMNNSAGLRLGYTITEVKMPFLYDFCFDKLFEQRIMRHDYTFGERYEMIEAAPWEANNAYQLKGNISAEWTYLVCYERCILQITSEWELTEEQMGMIGEKINSLAQ